MPKIIYGFMHVSYTRCIYHTTLTSVYIERELEQKRREKKLIPYRRKKLTLIEKLAFEIFCTIAVRSELDRDPVDFSIKCPTLKYFARLQSENLNPL